MKTFLLLFLLTSNAMAWNLVTDPTETIWNDTVRENLIRFADEADLASRLAWLAKLGCWTELQGSSVNVVCQDHGERIKWQGQPQIETSEPLYIMVPVDGIVEVR